MDTCIGITNQNKRCNRHISRVNCLFKCSSHKNKNQCGVIIFNIDDNTEKYCNIELDDNVCSYHPNRNNMETLYSKLGINTNRNTNTNTNTNTNVANIRPIFVNNIDISNTITNVPNINFLDVLNTTHNTYLTLLRRYNTDHQNRISTVISESFINNITDEFHNIYPEISRDIIYSSILSMQNDVVNELYILIRNLLETTLYMHTLYTTTMLKYTSNEPNEDDRISDCNICSGINTICSNIYKCCDHGKNICKDCVKKHYEAKNVPNPPCPFCRGNPSTVAIQKNRSNN